MAIATSNRIKPLSHIYMDIYRLLYISVINPKATGDKKKTQWSHSWVDKRLFISFDIDFSHITIYKTFPTK